MLIIHIDGDSAERHGRRGSSHLRREKVSLVDLSSRWLIVSVVRTSSKVEKVARVERMLERKLTSLGMPIY